VATAILLGSAWPAAKKAANKAKEDAKKVDEADDDFGKKGKVASK
jgi:hypothetical protein